MVKSTMKKVRYRTYKTVGLGRIGIDPILARQKGCFREAGNQYCRQPLIGNALVGKVGTVAFAFDVVVPMQYAIISADKLQPSHLGNVENPKHFLPEAQPRNRATSQSGAETPRRMADNLRPAEIIEGANAYTGAAVTNNRGEVIQGNGRAYAMKFYWDKYPNDPKGYLDYLVKNAGFLGFPKSKIAKLSKASKPVLIRMTRSTDQEAIKLGQYKQSDLEALSTKSNEIKSRVNLIDDKKLARVLDNVFSKSEPDASLSEVIRSTNLLTQLIRLGAIRTDQLEEFTRNGTINARGVQYVADIMLNLIFKGADTNTPEIYSQLPVKIQNAILKATPTLLRVDESKKITKEVSKAIVAIRDYENSEAASVGAWEKQSNMFTGGPRKEYSDFERKLVEIFTTSRLQKEIISAFEKYAIAVTDQEADLVTPFRKGYSKEVGIRYAFFGESPKTTSTANTANSKSKAMAMKLKLMML